MEAHYIQEMGSKSQSLKILYIKVLWEVKNLNEDNSYCSSDCSQRKEAFPKHKGHCSSEKPTEPGQSEWTLSSSASGECRGRWVVRGCLSISQHGAPRDLRGQRRVLQHCRSSVAGFPIAN